ncbi:hypothetical protein L1887_14886 [Cichorium endivia]|nr:hypothetical protein L1887_14886 [Cichorium endivia]
MNNIQTQNYKSDFCCTTRGWRFSGEQRVESSGKHRKEAGSTNSIFGGEEAAAGSTGDGEVDSIARKFVASGCAI